ncbi:bile acid:sodium symporter family protein [Geminocystis sp. CENA526]|uniref:bile acid:sodium symporter family protein n=1 Tax=Geminocystis sp. CENA526 TaxID=1355871 RepID=UPI003D6DC159
MQGNLLTEVFLPLALTIIMLGMGLSLTIKDFKAISIEPKAVLTGLFCQLILLPLVAFGLMYFWDLKPEFAVGVILLSACPGGPTSNLYSYLGRCDVALSVSLTAISSFITIFSIPFLVNYGMEVFMGEGQYIALPVVKTIIQILIITIVPIIIGMSLRNWKPNFARQAQKPFQIASGIFIAIIVLGAILKDRENVIPFFQETGLPTLTLNVLAIILSLLIARLVGLNFRQSSAISIESGIQNGTLGITIASSSTLLNNPTIAIAPAIYSIIMFITGSIICYLYRMKNDV